MVAGVSSDLFLAALSVGLIGLWISGRDLSFPVAWFISGIKVIIPFVYFAWFFDGTWIFKDDVSYFVQGSRMLGLGYTPITALLDVEGLRKFMAIAGGPRILYAWWNLLAQFLFGVHYYSAVFLNVLFTFVSGYFFAQLLRAMGFSEQYRRWALVFFLLHWDIIVWSSFVNLKETLVMTLTVISLLLLVKMSQKFQLLPLVGLSLLIIVFAWVRFYVPFLLLSATGIWLGLQWRSKRKFIFILITFVVFFVMFPWGAKELEFLRPTGFPFGIVRFFVTPQPWSIEKASSFLLLPSIFHWFLVAPVVFSGWLLWRRHEFARLPLVYLMVVVTFYAMVPLIQGPRHRVQVTFILAWLQFHFLWMMIKGALRTSASLSISK